jgi:phosphohistidine phosphatase
MKLYLVQHGEAVPKEVDPERPLTDSGRGAVRKMATYIAQYTDTRIDTIYHSGKTRALQTAEIFARELGLSDKIKEGKELNPQSQPWGWVEKLSDVRENLMIVGHLPYLKRLASLLVCQDDSKKCVEFRQGGVVCLERDESGIWSILWIIVPPIIP